MTTRRWALSAVVMAMLGVATLGAVANSGRADCPGSVSDDRPEPSGLPRPSRVPAHREARVQRSMSGR